MKKACIILAVLLLLGTCFLFVSCETEELPTRTLNVYNWGQYISDGSYDLPDTNAMFVEYFNENLAEEYGYNIRINYSTYASCEDMYNKIASGSASFDVIIPSEYMIERMINENMLYELDYSLIPNITNLDDRFRNEYSSYDPEGRHSVPYTYSMVGIIYNADYVDEEDIGSWDLLWNEKYSGKILQFNNPRDAFGTALYYQGYSVNTIDHSKWNAALALLKEQKPLVQAYVMDEIFNKMISASAYIAPYYSGDFFTMYDSNDSLAFYYPEEGTNIFVDAMCIPTCAKNVEAAHAYIDFMLTEEPAIANAEYLGYGCPNRVVTENEDYIAYMNDWHEDAMEILYGQEFIVSNYEDLRDIEADVLRVSFYRSITNTAENGNLLDFTNEIWSELKIESTVEPWIIVTDIAIVGALLAWAIFTYVRRILRQKNY